MRPDPISLGFRFVLNAALAALAALVLGCGDGDAMDELTARQTLGGTPLEYRGPECFPAEPRDLLWEMDQVADAHGDLQPLDFDENGDQQVDNEERDAIRGRNTWLVWGGGNETFWNWLQQQGYGLTDFLILLDSRQRDTRFARTGLINQPGFKSSTRPFLGLYLDEPKDDSVLLRPPQKHERETGYSAGDPPDYRGYYAEPEREYYDAQGRELPPDHEGNRFVKRPPGCDKPLFTPWTTREKRALEWPVDKKRPDPFAAYIPQVVREHLAQDGFDPAIYGYPSGIFGLRLWLNPDFFADTEDAERARSYWRERVDTTTGRYYSGRYYTDSSIQADPDLVRPFRVSMSCGFCHIGPHPLNPPKDLEHPEWKNLSGIIGGQYWDPQTSLGDLLTRKDFLYHFLRSQAPGTVDTSLISTDQINNTNVINAIFDVPARLARAKSKPTEKQSPENLLLQGLEDEQPRVDIVEAEEIHREGGPRAERHFPMVLFPGEDSVGVVGALARVYLNIGLFSEQWNRVDNPVIGLTPQRPFRIEAARANSVFWNVNEKYRVPYLAKFFTLGAHNNVPKSTAPMRLKDAGGGEGRAVLERDGDELRRRGRDVFVDHCAICHSSKQPEGFDLRFDLERKVTDWAEAKAPAASDPPVYTLPADYTAWDAFKQSPAYRDYVSRLRKEISRLEGQAPYDGKIDAVDLFIRDNFLSNELRIPVTLVGTYSGRAMATNAMSGQVWDNFSSETFKSLPSVGKIRFYDPYSEEKLDAFGTNADYSDGRTHGGPGYFRPASLISVWATAPYLHNNTLGIYTHQPSIEGRLQAFDDGIRKLLWKDRRTPHAGDTGLHPGDLRLDAVMAKDHQGYARDPGYIYRVPVDTQLAFAAKFAGPLIAGVLNGLLGSTGGRVVYSILSFWLWVVLVALFIIGVLRGRARHVGILLILLVIVLGAGLAATGTGGGSGGTVMGMMMMLGMGLTLLASLKAVWLWAAIAALGLLGFWLLVTSREWRGFTRGVFAVFALLSLVGGILVNGWLNGRFGGIRLGPIPRGTPVNLLMNIDPAKTDKLPAAITSLLRALAEIKQRDLTGDDAYVAFSRIAGPALMAASKVPDFVLDRGHWFGEHLYDRMEGRDDRSDPEKQQESDRNKVALIAFLKTL